MQYQNILITGGSGFIGSNIALRLKATWPEKQVTVLDNFCRNGSRLNVSRLTAAGVEVREGDVRDRPTVLAFSALDLIIDCAAEPSVLAGRDGDPLYVTDVNLGGTLNCLELARQTKAHFVFLSTSRVYPIAGLNAVPLVEEASRFAIDPSVSGLGISPAGVAEDFPLAGDRTLYGATKLASELFVAEFIANFGLTAVINRFGVVCGPWQFGKVDQGFVALWLANHWLGKPLSYIGFGGEGKQVRDILHVDDLCDALFLQLADLGKCSGQIYNIGGGVKNSVSLQEMTGLCQKVTGQKIAVQAVPEGRPGDIKMYITDHGKFSRDYGWAPKRGVEVILHDIYQWMISHEVDLRKIF